MLNTKSFHLETILNMDGPSGSLKITHIRPKIIDFSQEPRGESPNFLKSSISKLNSISEYLRINEPS